MAQGLVPTVETQKTEVAKLLETPFTEGDSWFLVDTKWLEKWKTYVGFEPFYTQNAGVARFHPGPIDNSPLFDENTRLKSDVSEEDDFELFPAEAWIKMVAWYGLEENQEPIERYVIQNHSGGCEVEIFLKTVQLCEWTDINHVIVRQFSSQCTQEQLEREMRRLFGIQDEAEVRLFRRFKGNKKSSEMEEGREIFANNIDIIALKQTKNASATLVQLKRMTTYSQKNVDWECPICLEQIEVPKILPCTHLACAHCVLSWLQKGGRKRGCPLCHVPILAPTSSSLRDLAALVDDLPTDLAPLVQVELDPALKGPHHCGMCPGIVMARSYCFQCGIKLCASCTEYHRKLPVSKEHPLIYLIYTRKELASAPALKCPSHRDRLVERYCSTHKELLCTLCSTSSHSFCEQVKALADLTQEKREELKQQAQRLTKAASDLEKQIDYPKDARRKVKDVFDDLQQRINKRRLEIQTEIQEKEDKMALRQREALIFHTDIINNLLTSAPDDSVVSMVHKLGSATSLTEQEVFSPGRLQQGLDVLFDSHSMAELHMVIDRLGQIDLPALRSTTPATTGTCQQPQAQTWRMIKLGRK